MSARSTVSPEAAPEARESALPTGIAPRWARRWCQLERRIFPLHGPPASGPLGPTRTWAAGIGLGVVGFWFVLLLAGEQVPAYSPVHDTVSALAGDDVSVKLLGVVAGALFFAAHIAAAVLLYRWGERAGAVLVGMAALCGLGILVDPVTCPKGAAGCSDPLSGRGAPDMQSVLHRDFAVAYEILFAATFLVVAVALVRQRRSVAALAVLAVVALGAVLALRIASGEQLGLWERSWLLVNSLVLLGLAALAVGFPRRPTGAWAVRAATVGALVLAAALIPVAIAAQPAFDLRHDLLSDLAARGVAYPGLGQLIFFAAALAYAGGAVLAGLWRWWVPAGTAAVAAGAIVAVALVPIQCPRGADGCQGADSGRPHPRPPAAAIHRDLVVVYEVAAVIMLLALAVHLVRTGHRKLAALAVGIAVTSPAVLGAQQLGVDIGWFQAGWLALVETSVVLVVLADRAMAPGDRGHRVEPG